MDAKVVAMVVGGVIGLGFALYAYFSNSNNNKPHSNNGGSSSASQSRRQSPPVLEEYPRSTQSSSSVVKKRVIDGKQKSVSSKASKTAPKSNLNLKARRQSITSKIPCSVNPSSSAPNGSQTHGASSTDSAGILSSSTDSSNAQSISTNLAGVQSSSTDESNMTSSKLADIQTVSNPVTSDNPATACSDSFNALQQSKYPAEEKNEACNQSSTESVDSRSPAALEDSSAPAKSDEMQVPIGLNSTNEVTHSLNISSQNVSNDVLDSSSSLESNLSVPYRPLCVISAGEPHPANAKCYPCQHYQFCNEHAAVYLDTATESQYMPLCPEKSCHQKIMYFTKDK